MSKVHLICISKWEAHGTRCYAYNVHNIRVTLLSFCCTYIADPTVEIRYCANATLQITYMYK